MSASAKSWSGGPKISARGLIWLTLAACAVLLAPLLVVDVPPLLDYPNHLARAWVLAVGLADPVVAAMYVPHWAVIPNLAVDLALPPLLWVLPVHVAGRVLLGVSLLLPVAGCVLYSRAAFGRWSAWPVASVLVAPNGLFLLGFVNFQLGLGLALLAAAAWVARRERHPWTTVLTGAVCAACLFFAHLTGLGLFLILVGGYEAERLLWFRARLVRRAIAALPLLAGPAALYGLSAFGAEPAAVQWETWHDKAVRIAMGTIAYDLWFDLAVAVLVVALLLLGAARGRLAARPHTAAALAGLAVLFAIAPFGLKGTGYLDARFAVMAAMLLFAGLRPALPVRAGWVVGLALAAVFLARTGRIAEMWAAHAADLRDLRAAIATVAPGERVLPALADTAEVDAAHLGLLRRQTLADGSRIDCHTTALLLIERQAFWPVLFARPEQQPIALRSPYRELAASTDGIATVAQLATLNLAGRYDAVLLLQGGATPGFARPDLVPVYRSDYATLFRVVPLSPGPSGSSAR